jgi:uncharacterized protein (TIGR00725 family)
MIRRRTIVGVMGSGERPFPHLAQPLGELIARRGHHLLTGGGGGVMTAAARAFCGVSGRRGLSLGVIRSRELPQPDPETGRRVHRPAAVNDWVEVAIHTHLPLSSEAFESRNHLNVLTADVLVALPGGAGTLSEVRLRWQYGRPALLFLDAEGDGARIGGKHAGELIEEGGGLVTVAATIEEVGDYLARPPG